ncbi:hypothetical protein Back11_37420 [Paenibacillus baekrokdamisoli]|uniref:Uncharacterized protein n=1 Tax=Paenibacillus baekrokdamisoli TaxID=1712516 RepID=A0A3G9IU45_9BACL|nr:hypothetical protein Back11_37420 [Paenibacillus baekrokdamisoli]
MQHTVRITNIQRIISKIVSHEIRKARAQILIHEYKRGAITNETYGAHDIPVDRCHKFARVPSLYQYRP